MWASSGAVLGQGSNIFTRGGSLPLCFLEKGDEVANLVDSFLMEKITERPLLSRANTGSSLAKDLGVLVLALAHLKSTSISWSEKVFRGSTVSHLKTTAIAWSGKGGDEHIRVKGDADVAAAILLRGASLGWERANRRLPCHG